MQTIDTPALYGPLCNRRLLSLPSDYPRSCTIVDVNNPSYSLAHFSIPRSSRLSFFLFQRAVYTEVRKSGGALWSVEEGSVWDFFKMSPTPDNTSQDNNGTSVVMATPPAAAAAATAVPTAAERAAAAVMENPYLTGLGKKTRGLKKKLEKIKKTESFSKSGKVLYFFFFNYRAW